MKARRTNLLVTITAWLLWLGWLVITVHNHPYGGR